VNKDPAILITVDVEDWFQVENFKPWIPFESWDRREQRVEKNVHSLLDLFDSLSESRESGPRVRATFFILGWLAERLPHMVREIHLRGHEVASHGYFHRLPNRLDPDALLQDLRNSKALLEDTIGEGVEGFRAPSFAIGETVLAAIEKSGYRYDSSYNSFALHGRYGKIDLSNGKKRGIAIRLYDGFWELPVSNLMLGRFVFPWSGGGYFRLLPFFLFKQGINKIIKSDQAYVIYLHPWEIDPDQPKVQDAYPMYRFRHYINLKRTFRRLEALIQEFGDCSFVSCKDYLHMIGNKSHPEGIGR
jgi:polysaccharide deacetylase family protein (PEP-CTERM system associated)